MLILTSDQPLGHITPFLLQWCLFITWTTKTQKSPSLVQWVIWCEAKSRVHAADDRACGPNWLTWTSGAIKNSEHGPPLGDIKIRVSQLGPPCSIHILKTPFCEAQSTTSGNLGSRHTSTWQSSHWDQVLWGTRPQNQLSIARTGTTCHGDSRTILQGASTTLHIILLGVDGGICNTLTKEPLKDSWLSNIVKKPAPNSKCILLIMLLNLSTRRVLSSTNVNSHQELDSGQACNPPDPHWHLCFPLWWRGLR
jgi:hypothetical protein